MKIIEQPRHLNACEMYPCSLKELRNKFKNANIYIGIGINRKYAFDYSCKRKPCIKGTVVASISLNKRISADKPEGQLRVFQINRSVYTQSEVFYFDSVILDKMLIWYNKQFEDDMNNCVKCMIVEYYRGDFLIHHFEFQ